MAQDSTPHEIGFIGVGTMGMPMARNLAAAGYSLTVYDADADALERAVVEAGASPADNPAEIASRVDVLFTCLPNNDIVTETYLGAGGVAEGARQGLITCDTSTVSPEISRRIHAELQPKGVTHMDTPMLGSQPQAESGEIFYIVAGEAEALPTIEPLLAVMGKMHIHVGPSGTGNQIKLIHNALGAVNAVAVAESVALAVQAGVDPHIYYEVVRNGGGMAYSTYFDRRVKRVLAGEYSPMFALELMHKDVRLATELAQGAGLTLPIMDETRRTFAEAEEQGWGKEDFSAVTHVIEKRIGRKLVVPEK